MEVYQRSTGYPEMQSLLDLMIFSLALGEANKYNSPEMKRFWEQSRRQISRISSILLGTMSFDKSSNETARTFESRAEMLDRMSQEAGIDAPRKLSSTSTPAEWFEEPRRGARRQERGLCQGERGHGPGTGGDESEADFFHTGGASPRRG